MQNNIGDVYGKMDLTCDTFPADDQVDPKAYEAAAQSFQPGDVAVIFTPDDTHFDKAHRPDPGGSPKTSKGCFRKGGLGRRRGSQTSRPILRGCPGSSPRWLRQLPIHVRVHESTKAPIGNLQGVGG